MTVSRSRQKFLALSLLLVGSVTAYNIYVPSKQRVGPDWFRGSFVLLGPVLLISGAVLSVLELATWRRSCRTKAATGDSSSRWVLWMGLTMLLIGGFPWAYTPLFFRYQGIYDNGQGSGMLGTLIFLVLGLPGLAVTLIGVSRMRKRRQTGEKVPDGP